MTQPIPESYEAAYKELEEITKKQQVGGVALDELAAYVERGRELREYCLSQLRATREQIETKEDTE
ncbi:exonuclease VII small subunit [Gordonia phage Yvonnetastic]|uniref:Exonuclease VII small subunit n=1 Tax=Gordonia phage Yvonnetastic TaxID=1821566 RepID=A0A142K923_9CAUD|nr:exonuclease VII small subunit [Gordonia phage Yvonnetastic]AMS02606.1 exonuclease VII small subunit [Gordonia phage Yvonnetastic]WKW86038.1 exonuclease VII, small subunit [Gordonia Phage JonJames]